MGGCYSTEGYHGEYHVGWDLERKIYGVSRRTFKEKKGAEQIPLTPWLSAPNVSFAIYHLFSVSVSCFCS